MNENISGGISGIFQIIIGHPFDTIKTRLQYGNNFKFNFKLYKGFKYPLYSSILINSTIYSINNKMYNYLDNYFISGYFTGSISSIIKNPFDIYKIKLQNSYNILTIDNYYRGFIATYFRESLGMSLYFGTYYYACDITNNYFMSGGIAGLISWLGTYPIDVIKTRIQTNNILTYREAILYGKLWKGFLPCSIRSVLVNSVGFYIFESSNNLLKDYI